MAGDRERAHEGRALARAGRPAGVHPFQRERAVMEDLVQLEENAGYAATFKPMTAGEQSTLVEAMRPYATELLYYKP